MNEMKKPVRGPLRVFPVASRKKKKMVLLGFVSRLFFSE